MQAECHDARINGGYYSPDYFTEAITVDIVPGDVNGDGYITSSDVTVIYNMLLGDSYRRIATFFKS